MNETPTRVLFAAATILTVSIMLNKHVEQVHCSSYLDEYFLPTAKMALNKIQQSLHGQSSSGTQLSLQNNKTTTTETILQQQQEQQQQIYIPNLVTSVISTNDDKEPEKRKSEEPNKNEFVKLDTSSDFVPAPRSELVVPPLRENREPAVKIADAGPNSVSNMTIISSTSAANLDPTSTVASAADNEQVSESSGGSASGQQESTSIVGGDTAPIIVVNNEPVSLTTSSSSLLATTTEISGSSSSASVATATVATSNEPSSTDTGMQSIIESKSAEEAVKETEMEALAAVDASIGFGDLFASMSDPCYDEYGNARYCEPDFENTAFEKQVDVSSECGNPPSRFCTAYLNERNDQIRNCHICDSQHPKKRHPAAYLTDLNNSNNPTCWVSAPISAALQTNNSINADQLKSDNVTLVLNLDKKYEIIYISLQFCSMKPDSLAIFKSMDFGRSWSPYQFYSSQCRRMYGRQSRATAGRTHEPMEPGCMNSSQLSGQSPASSGRIAFSTLDGRSVSHNLEKSQSLQDWITATNIKIVLDRHQANWISSNVHAHAHAHHQYGPQELASKQQQQRSDSSTNSSDSFQSSGAVFQSSPELENSLTSPSDTFNYAMSDLTVGGRCKCNGHASRCIHSKEGRLQCDCRHNTAGRDCEKCAPFHFDRPWARATQLDASQCQPCNCNGHSRKCRFDAELYRLSGKRSGGVCIGCRDNTAGRYCHYCKEGFTRDHSKSMSDKEACKHCDCHPIGSLGRVCNLTTGQCPCKEGVAGLQCNRCAPGYQQSSSLTEPCIKLPENDINYEPSLTVDSDEQPTNANQQNPPSNEPSIANSENSNESQQAQTPSGAGLRFTKNKIDPEDNESSLDQDKDDDNESSEEFSLARKHRPQNTQWPHQRKQVYYRYHMQRNRHQFEDQPVDEEEEISRMRNPNKGYFDDEHPVGHVYQQQPYNSYNKQRFVPDFRQRRPQSARPRTNDVMMQPIANLDQGADDLGTLDESSHSNYATNSMYNEDNFNQIETTNPQSSLRRVQQSVGRVRQPTQTGRHRFDNEQPVTVASEVSCGNCQSGTRRFGFRQFCHLDYAIKATILNKFMAVDWTKFDVEIQDIFKSPTSDSMLNGRGVQLSTNYIDNMVQADEADLSGGQRTLQNRTYGAQENAEQLPAAHRIKVGTVQSIWVPTEDLTCKCPRMKLRSTYVLMGSIDSKENSVNSLQLDRHGVALEWKSSVQEKLIRYQRRNSAGRCLAASN